MFFFEKIEVFALFWSSLQAQIFLTIVTWSNKWSHVILVLNVVKGVKVFEKS